ncbi:hypothetical protein TNCV_4164961 [Trichonephila clavipes]|nr:hypothetical protein TNCV_4164961 [Trichonephila clavipes]
MHPATAPRLSGILAICHQGKGLGTCYDTSRAFARLQVSSVAKIKYCTSLFESECNLIKYSNTFELSKFEERDFRILPIRPPPFNITETEVKSLPEPDEIAYLEHSPCYLNVSLSENKCAPLQTSCPGVKKVDERKDVDHSLRRILLDNAESYVAGQTLKSLNGMGNLPRLTFLADLSFHRTGEVVLHRMRNTLDNTVVYFGEIRLLGLEPEIPQDTIDDFIDNVPRHLDACISAVKTTLAIFM